MKIILSRDVKGLGRKGEVKEVPQGYAENFLLRNRYAVVATSRAVADHEAKQRREADERATHDAVIRGTLSSIDGKRIELKEKANERGHLFAKVPAAEIGAAIESQLGPAVDVSWIELGADLREVGERAVTVRAAGAEAKVTVAIIAS